MKRKLLFCIFALLMGSHAFALKAKLDPKTGFCRMVDTKKPCTGNLRSSNQIADTITPFKNGKIEGVEKAYFKNGALWSEMQYQNGRKHGYHKIYRQNGRLEAEENYQQDKKHGYSIYYDINGNIISKELYKNNKLLENKPKKQQQQKQQQVIRDNCIQQRGLNVVIDSNCI